MNTMKEKLLLVVEAPFRDKDMILQELEITSHMPLQLPLEQWVVTQSLTFMLITS